MGFKVKKMGLYHVRGRFSGVEGRLEVPGEGASARGEVLIDAATINTRIPPRDWHLRTKDFLDTGRYPQIRVHAEGVDTAPEEIRVHALFEIHGERREVELTGHLHGIEGAPSRTVLHLQGTLDRHDFGVRARPPVEWIVGRDVHLEVELALEFTS